MLGASTIGAVVGVLLVPRAAEARGRAADAGAVRVVGGPGRGASPRSWEAGSSRAPWRSCSGCRLPPPSPAFDALVQRYVPPAAQGRAFARFETRLQLVWVVGALIPVIAAMPFVAGDIVVAAVACGRGGDLHDGQAGPTSPLRTDPPPEWLRPAMSLSAQTAGQPRRAVPGQPSGQRAGSAEAPLERVDLVDESGREPRLELSQVLADERHLRPPFGVVHLQQLGHVVL